MKKEKLLLFFITAFCFNMAASFVHPVTPTLIVERQLDSSMFGVALAAMMTMNFLFSPFWGRLCAYVPTKLIMLVCSIGYAVGQLLFGSAYTEAAVVGGRMFAGAFTGGVFTAMANYVVNLSRGDAQVRGQNLVILTTLQNVGSACGYFVGGMLGLLSVRTAFMAQVVVLVASGIAYYLLCADDTDAKVKPDRKLSLRDANPFAAFLSARRFMTPLLAMVFMIVAISAIGQNSYEQCFNYYIKDQYGMSSAYNGMFKAGIAILTIFLNSTVSMYLQRNTEYHLFQCHGAPSPAAAGDGCGPGFSGNEQCRYGLLPVHEFTGRDLRRIVCRTDLQQKPDVSVYSCVHRIPCGNLDRTDLQKDVSFCTAVIIHTNKPHMARPAAEMHGLCTDHFRNDMAGHVIQ